MGKTGIVINTDTHFLEIWVEGKIVKWVSLMFMDDETFNDFVENSQFA